jgi:hypothetical protein
MDTINYNLLNKIYKSDNPELDCYAIINKDSPDAKDHRDYIELHSSNPHLEMIAKLMAEEIVTEASFEWPGFDDCSLSCLYILPLGSLDIIKQWAAEYTDSRTLTL